jgi:hypothetical protein
MESDKPYPELLIEYIKDVGQELIDRAEEMVNKDTNLIGDFWIDIRFDQEMRSLPTIEWGTQVLCKRTCDRYI